MYLLKKILLKDAKPGMKVGRMVLTDENKVIISEGTILTDILLSGLDIWGIKEIFIKEEVAVEEDFPRDFSVRKTEPQRRFYKKYDETLDIIKSSFYNIRHFKEVPLEQFNYLADYSIQSMISTVGAINHLNLMKKQDDHTFHHSVNVSAICGVLGKWMGFTGEKLKNLILAGLLHDVGKNKLPLEILNKSGELTPIEYETIKQHPVYGYQMIYLLPDISHEVALGVLQHHERVDGSGYPLGVKAEKISEFAKIIAVADIYDTMTSDNLYNIKVNPYEVVDMLAKDAFGKLDPEAAITFSNNVKDFFIGNIVYLNDGREAEVIASGRYLASRPVVYAKNGEIIDLEKRQDISITKVKEHSN